MTARQHSRNAQVEHPKFGVGTITWLSKDYERIRIAFTNGIGERLFATRIVTPLLTAPWQQPKRTPPAPPGDLKRHKPTRITDTIIREAWELRYQQHIAGALEAAADALRWPLWAVLNRAEELELRCP